MCNLTMPNKSNFKKTSLHCNRMKIILKKIKWANEISLTIPLTAASKSWSEFKPERAASTKGWEASVGAGILESSIASNKFQYTIEIILVKYHQQLITNSCQILSTVTKLHAYSSLVYFRLFVLWMDFVSNIKGWNVQMACECIPGSKSFV